MDLLSAILSRYYTEALCSHWSKNKTEVCLLSPMDCRDTVEDIRHILQICPALSPIRQNLALFTETYSEKIKNPEIGTLLTNLCDANQHKLTSYWTAPPYLGSLQVYSNTDKLSSTICSE